MNCLTRACCLASFKLVVGYLGIYGVGAGSKLGVEKWSKGIYNTVFALFLDGSMLVDNKVFAVLVYCEWNYSMSSIVNDQLLCLRHC